MTECNRKRLVDFLYNRMDVEERLDMLFHLDECPRCWDEVYNFNKNQHPHYYKTTSRQVKINPKDLVKFDVIEEEEEVFEVA